MLKFIEIFIITALITSLHSKEVGQAYSLVSDKKFHLYMSPLGKDNNSGTSKKSALKTLQRVHDIIEDKLKDNHRNVIVHIGKGIYEAQKVKWRFTMPKHSIMLKGEKNTIPVFDGNGTAYAWLRMTYHKGSNQSNLHIDGLQIQHYARAILFMGDKNDWHKDVSRNVVKNCIFYNLGDKYSSAPVGYAAISLVNSRHNVFKNNSFINIINNKTKCKKSGKCFSTDTLIHAIYMSYYSSYNIIRNSLFENISGDAIRVRDYCNNNTIEDNVFKKVRRVYQDWYNSYKNIKNEDHVECYSWGNSVKDNKIGSQFYSNKNAPLLDVKTKFYKKSGQKNYCKKNVYEQYNIRPYPIGNTKDSIFRVIEFNNRWFERL